MPSLLATAHLAPLIIHTDHADHLHGDGSMMVDGLMTSSSSASNGSSTLAYPRTTTTTRPVGTSVNAPRGMDAQLPCDPPPRVHLPDPSLGLSGGGGGGGGGNNSDSPHVFFPAQEPTATVNNSSTSNPTPADSTLSSALLNDDGRHSNDTETSSNALTSDAGPGKQIYLTRPIFCTLKWILH